MSITLSNRDKLTLISNLATMLAAGIPILEAVDSIAEDAKGSQKKVLAAMKRDLSEGKTLSASFAQLPKAFDPVTINLVQAAEEAGTLDETLKDLTISIKKDIEFSDKIKAALTYPLFVIGVFVAVLLLILAFVVPRVAQVFGRLRVELPLPTRILIFLSNALLQYTPYIIAATLLLGLMVAWLYVTKKRELMNVVFSLPLLRVLARQIDLARFTRAMALLLSSGIPITDALELAGNVTAKKEMFAAIGDAKKQVAAGKNISESFRKNAKLIPSIVVRITEAGERSGTLEQSMQELSEYFEGQVSNTLKTLTTLLEPVMMVVIGLLVGGMMLSIIAPIYQLIGSIRSR